MWRSDKDKPESRLLPAANQQLTHAKAYRARAGYFRELNSAWTPVVRKPVVVEVPEVPTQDDPNLPAYLRHRPTGSAASKGPKLCFRTKAVTRKKPK